MLRVGDKVYVGNRFERPMSGTVVGFTDHGWPIVDPDTEGNYGINKENYIGAIPYYPPMVRLQGYID